MSKVSDLTCQDKLSVNIGLEIICDLKTGKFSFGNRVLSDSKLFDSDKDNNPIKYSFDDKIYMNMAIQIKVDPITKGWYLKNQRQSHSRFIIKDYKK